MLSNQKELVLLQDLGMQYPTQNSKRRARYGLYKCHCGTEFKCVQQSVKSGKTTSCGCYQKQMVTTHGLRSHRLYKTWISMIHRCHNPKARGYENYGGRGIKVCNEWNNAQNFINDMYPSFKEGLSLDRIDNNLGYNPDNCRWATREIQGRNTRILCKNNTSGFRGVTFDKKINKFKSQIRVNYKLIHLGSFLTALDGAKAYDNYIISNNLEHTKNFNIKDTKCKTK